MLDAIYRYNFLKRQEKSYRLVDAFNKYREAAQIKAIVAVFEINLAFLMFYFTQGTSSFVGYIYQGLITH